MINSKISKMILFIAIFFIVFLILFSLYGFWTATHPPKYKTNLTPKDFGFKYEEVSLSTSDSIKLAAWFVPSEVTSDKVLIILHGYPFDKANILGWASFLHDDFNLFFFDFRYFGDSEGSMTTVGYHEQKDLKSALDYLERKKFSKIGAMGFSLGGAVAIMTAADGKRIKAVISDSTFANLNLMVDEYYRNLYILKYPFSILTKFWTRIFVGVDPGEVSPEKSAKNLQIPVLIIHSKKDQVIPFENALRIQKSLSSNAKAEFFFYEGGFHGGVPKTLEEEYRKKVTDFFIQNL